MGAAFGTLILVALAIIIIAAIVVMAIGLHVVKKYPNRNDPDRDAKRYTRPAAYCVGAILGGSIACVIGLIGLIVSGL